MHSFIKEVLTLNRHLLSQATANKKGGIGMGVEDSKFKHAGNKTMKEKNESLEPQSWGH